MNCPGNLNAPDVFWEADKITIKCFNCPASLTLPLYPVKNSTEVERVSTMLMELIQYAAYKRWFEKYKDHK